MQNKQLMLRTFTLILCLIFFSCDREGKVEQKTVVKHSKKSLEEINKLLVDKDAELIKSYVERRGWNMQVSESGLWYMVYAEGDGKNIKKDVEITFNYSVHLLDGTLCYSSEESGAKSFIVGKGGVESGLEEGVLLLRDGSKARFIMPPHLAHGLIGDENRIPARASIIYDIEILKVEE